MQFILNHFYLLLAISFGVVSQLIIKWQMSVFSFDDYETWQEKYVLAFSMLLNPFIIVSLILTLLAGITWMIAMTKFELSYAYPFTFLVNGEFFSLTQVGLKTFLKPGIFPIGSLDIYTELKGLNIIVNSLVHSSLSVTGRWILGAIATVIFLGTIIFTAHFDIDVYRDDKLGKFTRGLGFLLGFIPMIPIIFGGYCGILFLVLKTFSSFF